MLSFLITMFFFGFCIFIHEFGHLLAALKCGLHVEKFSIGFGKKIWGFHYKGVEYVISMLPFGGYVALPQLDPSDEPETSDGQKLPIASPKARIITAFAGPLANVFFGFFLAGIIWIVGIHKEQPAKELIVSHVIKAVAPESVKLHDTDLITHINGKKNLAIGMEPYWGVYKTKLTSDMGELTLKVLRKTKKFKFGKLKEERFEVKFTPVATLECKSGIKKGDKIIALNGKKFSLTPMQFREQIILAPQKTISLTVLPKDDSSVTGFGKEKVIKFEKKADKELEGLKDVKIMTCLPTRVFGFGKKITNAKDIGLQVGDVVVRINNDIIYGNLSEKLQKIRDKKFSLTVLRNGKVLRFDEVVSRKVMLKMSGSNERMAYYQLGIQLLKKVHPDPWSQFTAVVNRTSSTIKALFSHDSGVGVSHMGGPVMIITATTKKFSQGLMSGLAFTLFISFSLAFFNLLPIPVIDGGHITLAVTELIVKRRIPAKVSIVVQNAVAIFLISFMLFITFKDFGRVSKLFGNVKVKPIQEQTQPANAVDGSSVEK